MTRYPLSVKRRLAYSSILLLLAVSALLVLLHACSPSAIVHAIAVGDIACTPTDPQYNAGEGTDNECQAKAVSDKAVEYNPDILFGLGDYQYEVASDADYATAYDPTWGRLREVTRPAIGNQELKVNKASTFYNYFGDTAAPLPGYYSYDEGDWHIVVLNTNCTVVSGGCGPESPQLAWLANDLQENTGRCILAYGHHPRWSNGIAGPNNALDALYSTMVAGHVSLYLSGHESDYERFPPLNAAHQPDPRGVRQFVVGTGGQTLYQPAEGDADWRATYDAIPSDYFDATHPGFLSLTLEPGQYSWQFITADGDITDTGSATCQGRE